MLRLAKTLRSKHRNCVPILTEGPLWGGVEVRGFSGVDDEPLFELSFVEALFGTSQLPLRRNNRVSYRSVPNKLAFSTGIRGLVMRKRFHSSLDFKLK